jgi:hypothetical protein
VNDKIRDMIQDCNINFLLGSGLSCPYLRLVGNIEVLLTELESKRIDEVPKRLIRASLYKRYFDGAISGNLKILESVNEGEAVQSGYRGFLKAVNALILRRKSTILSKQINLFTTNIDVFLEKALDELGLEYNDGFNGRFVPIFSLSNFKKSRFRKSPHYDNTSELPVFNLLKLHGSITWRMSGKGGIVFSPQLEDVKETQRIAGELADKTLDIGDGDAMEEIVKRTEGRQVDAAVDAFTAAYEKLLIVNPTKEKFKSTLMNQTYYDLLRIYANELERENTVLFVIGFSFSDEHIRELTLRAANSNPTLMIYVVAYDSISEKDLQNRFLPNDVKNGNIQVIGPRRAATNGGASGQEDHLNDIQTVTAELFNWDDALRDGSEAAAVPD